MKCILMILAFFLMSCTEDSPTTIINAGVAVGSLEGKVQLYDTVYAPYTGILQQIDDASGAIVEIKGTQNFTTTTDRDGNWMVKDVPAGIYTITTKKDGFSRDVLTEHSFVGNGTYYISPRMLFRKSTISTELVLRAFEGYNYIVAEWEKYIDSNGNIGRRFIYDTTYFPQGKTIITVKVRYSLSDMKKYKTMIFFSNSPDIDPEKPETYQLTMGPYENNEITGTIDLPMTVPFFYASKFTSGQKVYCVAYSGLSNLSSTSYVDKRSQKQIYTGFSPNHSEVKSFVLP